VLTADSVEELAQFTKPPLTATARQVDVLKGAGAAGAVSPGWRPPAVRVTGVVFDSQGGLAVDDLARFRLAAAGVVPYSFPLSAAGCVISWPEALGYLSGEGLTSAGTIGRFAGEAATVVGAAKVGNADH